MTAAYFEDHPTDPDRVILRKPKHEHYVRPWVGLTDEEVDAAWGTVAWHSNKGLLELRREYAQAIEQALKEKNT